MKKKTLKRVAIALTMVMTVATLGGCGSSSTTKDTTKGTTEDAVVADEAISDEAPVASGQSVSAITFPLAEPMEMTVFVYATNTGGGTYQENYVTDWIKEKTNIQLNYVYDLDGDDAKTKLNLVMTNPDDMPDIFLATGWSKSEVQSYGQQGLIIPLNDYLSEAPNWNALNEVSPVREKDLTMADGNIYTYGSEDESMNSTYQSKMWIYKPWVDELLDGKVPETLDELYDYLVAIKENDPNGNGQADEIPLSGFMGGWATDPTVWLLNSFVQSNNPLANTNPSVGAGLVANNGKIEYSVMSEDYKEGLAFINKLYAEGLMDPQTFTQEETQYKATIDNEENLVGLHPGGLSYAGQAEFFSQKEGKWSDWIGLDPVEGPNGVRLASRTIDNYFASSIGSISANCKNPEIAVALFDFLATEEATNVQNFGPEELGWIWTEEGTSLGGGTPRYEDVYIPEDYDWLGNGYERVYKDSKNYRYASDAMISGRSYDWRYSMRIADPAEYNLEYVLTSISKSYEKYAPDVSTLVPNLAFEGEDAKTISEYTLTIGGYVNQAAVQFITGSMDVEKDWDTYLGKLDSMGVDNFIEIYQRYYDNYEVE